MTDALHAASRREVRPRDKVFAFMPVRELCEGARDGVIACDPWVIDAMRGGVLLVSPENVRVQDEGGSVRVGGWHDYLVRVSGQVEVVREGLFRALFEPVDAS